MSEQIINIGEVDGLKVTVLIDNSSGYDSPLLAQHALSLLIDIKTGNTNKRILLDVGQSAEPILHNMKCLDILPESIDMIYVSHCHYDHTRGLVDMLTAINKEIPIIAHLSMFRDNYINDPYLRNIGITSKNSRERIVRNGGQMVFVDKPFRLMDGVASSGEVERVTDYESTGIGAFNIINGDLVPDYILDDLALIVNVKGKGLFILSGCSHSGIINIVKHAVNVTGIDKIYGVMGGLHLINSSDEIIAKTAEELQKMKPELVVAGHCTGLKATSVLSDMFGKKFNAMHSGKVIDI